MIITYHGGHALKLTQGNLTIAINPPTPESNKKFSRFGADIVLESARHPDVAGGSRLDSGSKKPLVISGPGEYEKEGVFVYGIASETSYKGADLLNTTYYLKYEDLSICVLGLHESEQLPTDLTETIDEVDVLILPVVSDGVLSPVAAHKLSVKLEPKIIIPTGYDDVKNPDLQAFLKEADIKTGPVDKLTFKKSDLANLDNVIIFNVN